MSALEIAVMRRDRRRDHLIMSNADAPMCGTRTSLARATLVPIPLAGGATTRLRNDLTRELRENTCIPCTRIATGMLALYVSRDTGIAW